MSSSLQKSVVAKVVGVSLVMMLAACSNDASYTRQANGDESYLNTSAPHALAAPSGLILPVQNGDYDIPAASANGPVGKAVDVRPPVQPLALLNGSRGQVSGNTATLLLESSAQNGSLWPQVTQALQYKGYAIASRSDASQTLTTDWVNWKDGDDDDAPVYQARYQISVQPQGYQQALEVKLLALQLNQQPVTDVTETQRYAGRMLNALSNELDRRSSERDNAFASSAIMSLDVQSGADDVGLPQLVVRGSYNVVWERLPRALEKIGMTVTDRSRPQGSLSVTYREPNGSVWSSLGAANPQLPEGDYKLQVGDLGNRSSLQFIDKKGHPLRQSQNDALVAVLQAAFNK